MLHPNIKTKSSLYTRSIKPKRVTSGGVHLRDLVHEQDSCEETSPGWRAVSDTVSDLTGLGIEPPNLPHP